MEERFCQRVKALGCTCVTISHRPALMAFHDLVLALDGEGGWALHAGARDGGNSSASVHSEEAGDGAGGAMLCLFCCAEQRLKTSRDTVHAYIP
jgi:hypothetical protein